MRENSSGPPPAPQAPDPALTDARAVGVDRDLGPVPAREVEQDPRRLGVRIEGGVLTPTLPKATEARPSRMVEKPLPAMDGGLSNHGMP